MSDNSGVKYPTHPFKSGFQNNILTITNLIERQNKNNKIKKRKISANWFNYIKINPFAIHKV